jgi:hypothetical protein
MTVAHSRTSATTREVRLKRIYHRSAAPLTQKPIEIANARVLTLGWHVINPGHGVLVNSEVAHKKWLIQKGRAEPTVAYYPRSWSSVEQPCMLLGGYTNYYHHLVDYMFNLYYADRSPHAKSLPFLVLEMQHSFQHEIARHLGLTSDRLIEVKPLSVVRCRSLSVIPRSFRKFGTALDPGVFDWIRERFVGNGAGGRRRRIYISRRLAAQRKASNEAEVVALLKTKGFEDIALEELSFKAQVELFAECEVVVGAHGAGLSNVVFSPPGCTVIEITPEDCEPGRRFFENISTGAGHRFVRVPAGSGFRKEAFEVRLASLVSALKDVGLN